MQQYQVGTGQIKYKASVSTVAHAITTVLFKDAQGNQEVIFTSTENQNGDINKKLLDSGANVKGKTLVFVTSCTFFNMADENTFNLAVQNSQFAYQLFGGTPDEFTPTHEVMKSFGSGMGIAHVSSEISLV